MNNDLTRILFNSDILANDIDVKKFSKNQLMKIENTQIRYEKIKQYQELANKIKKAYLPAVLTRNNNFKFSKAEEDMTIEEILIELCATLIKNGLTYEDLYKISNKNDKQRSA